MKYEKDDAARDLIMAVINLNAMLDHYVSGRPHNWDGSTKAQARRIIEDGKAAIARARKAGIETWEPQEPYGPAR